MNLFNMIVVKGKKIRKTERQKVVFILHWTYRGDDDCKA